ncbi:MAG: class I SAM-dependent methyltransferase [Chloroflexota bacterium]
MTETIETKLIEAVYQKRLPQTCRQLLEEEGDSLAEADRNFVEQVLATCEDIGAYCTQEKQKILQKLKMAGANIPAGANDKPLGSRLFHTFEIELNPADLDLLIPILKKENYLFWNPVEGGGWEMFKRMNSAMEVIKTDAVTTRLIIRWGEDKQRSKIGRLMLPSTLDLQSLPLPKAFWPLYFAYRPVRIALDALNREKSPVLGPYLGTPTSLIKPILSYVGATQDDFLVDLGCGDGRVAIDAAEKVGCRAMGIEINDQLIEIARENVRAKGLQDKVTIEHSDASQSSVSDASIVFVFLPVSTVREMIPQLKNQLKAGAKIITHEQGRPQFAQDQEPDQSKLILASDAVTVAYIWEV